MRGEGDVADMDALIATLERLNDTVVQQAEEVAWDLFTDGVHDLEPTNSAEAFEAAATVKEYHAQMSKPLWQIEDSEGKVVQSKHGG
jgi:hypothetical protein